MIFPARKLVTVFSLIGVNSEYLTDCFDLTCVIVFSDLDQVFVEDLCSLEVLGHIEIILAHGSSKDHVLEQIEDEFV